MKLEFSRMLYVYAAAAAILFVGGKFALDRYFAVPENEVALPAPDELNDPRTTAELETLRFGKLDDEEIHRQCETLMQESGWTHGATLSEILAAGPGGLDAQVRDVFNAFRTSQVEQYIHKTKDPETVRPAAQELLKLWATIDVDKPNLDVLDQIGKSAHEAIAAGSTDPLIHTMALRYQLQSLDEAGLKRLAELPEELTAAGYAPIFPLLVQIFRFAHIDQNDAMNRRLVVKEIVRATGRCMDEYSSNKELDRVSWFNLYNAAGILNDGERELLYRHLLASEKTSPYILHLMAGFYYKQVAGNLRGLGFVDSVKESDLPAIKAGGSAASLHFRKAWLLRPDLPHAAWNMTALANGNREAERWSPRNWFELSCRAQFDFMPSYETFMYALLPRWGGSHEELLAFGEECAATKAFETAVPYTLVDCISQIAKETSGGKTWETPSYVKILTDFWAAMDHWGTENNIERTALQWKNQASFQAAVLIRNDRYAEAKAALDKIDGPPLIKPMLNILQDPPLAASSAYALAEPDAAPLVEIEKRFGGGIPRSATEEELDQAIKVVSEAKQKNQVLRATMYLAEREYSLTLQKKFLSGEWVDLPFDPELNHWRIQECTATVESPSSLRLSNLTRGDSTPLAIPRVVFAPPYELQVTLERIRGEQFFDRVGVNVGLVSQAVLLGEPGGMTFVTDDHPRVAGTYLPNGVQRQTYYLDGLEDKAMMGLQIWTGQYRLFVNKSLVPVRPVSDFRANGQLSFGANVWEVDMGEIRISDIRIRKMQTPSPPSMEASPEETIEYLTKVIELEPANVASRLMLADALFQNQKLNEAMVQYEAVHKMAPDITRIHGLLGVAFMESGREQEALQLLLSSLKSKPSDRILDGVAWIYATAVTESLRNGEESLRISTEICDRTQNQQWNYLATKAAAFAELKRFPEAIEVMQKTIALTPADNQEIVKAMLGEFQKSLPWRGKATE